MKKTLLSLIALVAIAVACGSKYPAEMTTLVDQTILKYDSVQTMEQYELVSNNYLTAAQAINSKYEVTEADAAVNAELSAKLTPSIEAALARAEAAMAAAMAADTVTATVVEEVVTK